MTFVRVYVFTFIDICPNLGLVVSFVSNATEVGLAMMMAVMVVLFVGQFTTDL